VRREAANRVAGRGGVLTAAGAAAGCGGGGGAVAAGGLHAALRAGGRSGLSVRALRRAPRAQRSRVHAAERRLAAGDTPGPSRNSKRLSDLAGIEPFLADLQGAKGENRTGRGFGWEMSSRGRFATPADLPRHDCIPYSHVHVRRDSWDLYIVQGTIFLPPRASP
jgi:hypothetical protein